MSTNDRPWWFPEIIDDAYFARLREEHPDRCEGLDNDALHDKFEKGRK